MAGVWDGWIGRESSAQDRLDNGLAHRWCATFDSDVPQSHVMPQGIHLCLCTPDTPTASLGEDGHPLRNDSAHGFLPPIPLPRRMWAASEMTFAAPIKIGAKIERTSRIASVKEKEGRSGRLGFVEVEHSTYADGALAVSEKQVLVYREASSADAPLSPPKESGAGFDPDGWELVENILPDERLLFRFSALTFNTHRIHYDLPYARDIERYRGLVVHGPLMASLLLQMAQREWGANQIEHFAFRAMSPAIAGEVLHLAARRSGKKLVLGAFSGCGREIIEASAELRG